MKPESREFTGTPDSVADARTFVSDHFNDDAIRDEAVLLVSEVATNAIRHVGGGYTVTIMRIAATTRILVKDPGSALTVPRLRPPSGTEEGGRGLALVEAIATSWGTTVTADGGRLVWFDIAAIARAVAAA